MQGHNTRWICSKSTTAKTKLSITKKITILQEFELLPSKLKVINIHVLTNYFHSTTFKLLSWYSLNLLSDQSAQAVPFYNYPITEHFKIFPVTKMAIKLTSVVDLLQLEIAFSIE